MGVDKVKSEFPTLRPEDLAFEAMVNPRLLVAAIYCFMAWSDCQIAQAIRLAFLIIPNITGSVHVMANPCYSYHKEKIIETGIHTFFDTDRLSIKVAATWKGLQACRELKICEIKTLKTAVFTMEQAILASEAGCVSPFVHELKVKSGLCQHLVPTVLFSPGIDTRTKVLFLTQQFYKKRSMDTKVKASSTISLDGLLQLAGVDALIIMAGDLQNLQKGTGCKRLTEIAIITNIWIIKAPIVLNILEVAKVQASSSNPFRLPVEGRGFYEIAPATSELVYEDLSVDSDK
ncbi:Aldolase-type TIM barrel [Penicillium fimorum]|uniref:Aldolase-type TIM barrel n=1 Tax=Penicillium fimorum TaxID=1882269 RepID=A0A9W9XLL0_9EURO|nr:Aldolase-type TIM barrel [Penicillium fimorum]